MSINIGIYLDVSLTRRLFIKTTTVDSSLWSTASVAMGFKHIYNIRNELTSNLIVKQLCIPHSVHTSILPWSSSVADLSCTGRPLIFLFSPFSMSSLSQGSHSHLCLKLTHCSSVFVFFITEFLFGSIYSF